MVSEPGSAGRVWETRDSAEPRMTGPIADRYDCIVVGAGPGGGTTAALVAQAGWKTLLVERDCDETIKNNDGTVAWGMKT